MDTTEDDDVDDEDATVVCVGVGDVENDVAVVDADEAAVAFEDGVDNDADEEEEKDDSAGDFLDDGVYFTAGPAAVVVAALGD